MTWSGVKGAFLADHSVTRVGLYSFRVILMDAMAMFLPIIYDNFEVLILRAFLFLSSFAGFRHP